MIPFIFHILAKIVIIAVIIGIIFLLLFLFTPIKYDVRASNIDCIKGSLHSDFIFKMISLEVFIKKKEKLITKIKLYLFGKLLWQSGPPKRKKKNPPPKNVSEESLTKKENTLPPKKEVEKAETPSDSVNEKSNVRRVKLSKTKDSPEASKPADTESLENKKEDSEDSLLKQILKMPDKGKLIKLTLKFISDIFKEIKPSFIYIRAKLGTGDPCSTGKYMGIAYAVSGFLGADTQITPDFENSVFEGKLQMKGQFYLFRIVYLGVRFILQKPVRNLIKILRKGKRDQ